MGIFAPNQRARINILIGDRRTSLSIEPEIWAALTEIARHTEMSVDELVGEIDNIRGNISRASAIRVFALDFFRNIKKTKVREYPKYTETQRHL
jgi:predicted DNA-binding ribbon-helix-helix protein